ncbi:hypothetical protein NC653_002912 [Populus alba x Populus x berolinensis]|uniref:Uncharacterized protein n=1 Tax=Populus alba x Populus x berolinensis TaxID=444605 RepID=A0AAD6WJT2_9ROSI|nr:hypothetical protein NC653_002912 [Populus alba x Populus x berolinensis]
MDQYTITSIIPSQLIISLFIANLSNGTRDLDQVTISKNFIPFDGGTRHYVGAEFSKLIISTFLHVLVTKYMFTKVKGGDVSGNPVMSFGDGIHIKFIAKY